MDGEEIGAVFGWVWNSTLANISEGRTPARIY